MNNDETNINFKEAYTNITRLFSTVTEKSTLDVLSYIATLFKDSDEMSVEEYLLGYKDGNGRTVSHFACSAKKNETLKALIKLAPGIVNSIDDSLENPLFISVRLCDIESVKILLSNEINITLKNIHGCNVLHYACQASDICLVKLLILFLKERCYTELDAFVNTCSDEFGTPLQWACITNNKEIINYLLLCGANPNIAPLDKRIPSPLMLTVSSGDIEATQLLLDSGAIIDEAKDLEGYTPLFGAIERNNLELLNLILQHMRKQSCDISSQIIKGDNIYSYAIKNKCSNQILDYLKTYALDIVNICEQEHKKQQTCDEIFKLDQSNEFFSTDRQMSELDSKYSQETVKEPDEENIEIYDEDEAEKLKNEANILFKEKNYNEAIALYTDALKHLKLKKNNLSQRGILLKSSILSNRCLAYMKVGDTNKALKDSFLCTYIYPTWSKGYYRSFQVYQIIGDIANQACCLWDAIVNENSDLKLKQEYLDTFSNLIRENKSKS